MQNFGRTKRSIIVTNGKFESGLQLREFKQEKTENIKHITISNMLLTYLMSVMVSSNFVAKPVNVK